MNMQSAVVATADRYSTFARVVTSVGAVYWLGTLEGMWTIIAVLFADPEYAKYALWGNLFFRLTSFLQLKARAYLELTGTNLPKPPDDTDDAAA